MKINYLIFFIPLLGLASSCVTPDQLMNFRDERFDVELSDPEDIINKMEPRIQPDDILRITVNSLNDEAAEPFNLLNQGGGVGRNNNMGGGNQGQGGGGLSLTGFMVDSLGYIDYPNLGRIPMAGLTLEAARDTIANRLDQYLEAPAVNVRFLNFRFTTLGEVNNPGTQTTFNKNITILEAISLSGDLSDYANRKNILIIRQQNGERIYGRIDIEQGNIFQSPFFYVKQNDIIYVEPLKARVATVADPFTRITSYISAVLGLSGIIIALVR